MINVCAISIKNEDIKKKDKSKTHFSSILKYDHGFAIHAFLSHYQNDDIEVVDIFGR